MNLRTFVPCLLLVLAASPAAGQPPRVFVGGNGYTAPAADVQAVRQVGLDYIDAIYEVSPEKVREAVHPSLVKIGYQRTDQGWRTLPMSFDQLLDVARTWNQSGTTKRPDAPRAVEVHEVLDKTASIKIVAQWGLDYAQLVKFDDGWRIVHIVWQSHPTAPSR